MKRHILTILAENKPGVLNRIMSLCRQRQFNVESLSAGYTEKKDISHITMVVDAGSVNVEQVKKQMYKLIDVVKVYELDIHDSFDRELALIKVRADKENRAHLLRLAETFDAKAIDMDPSHIIMEISATSERINAFLNVLNEYGVEELRRTGIIATPKLLKK